MPEKVWNLQGPVKLNSDALNLDRKQNEDEMWWNQLHLTHLDLSSNVLTEISGQISNLMDLTVLNVSAT